MRISLSGLNQQGSVFAKDKYLKLKHSKKNNKYSIEVKNNLTTTDKVSRFFSNAFGTECRNISKVLNSPEGQARLKKVGNKEVRANLAEINQKIDKLNKKMFVKHIPLINIPDLSSHSPGPTPVPTKEPTPKSAKKTANELVVSFYTSDNGKDIENRTLNDIWAFSHTKKEEAHNYIQWLFPLNEASQFNSKSPSLTPALITELLSTPKMQTNLRTSLDAMLNFYGLEWNDDHTKIKMSDSFEERAKVWLKPGDHNHLRITRILKCLRIFELEDESQALFNCLTDIKTQYPNKITGKSWNYWANTQK